MSIADDMFRVFISHKHEDHALAAEVKTAMEGLNPKLIECFVSGVDIPRVRTGGARSGAFSPRATSSCCCSPHRRRTGTGASSRPACTPASTGPRPARSFACSAPGSLAEPARRPAGRSRRGYKVGAFLDALCRGPGSIRRLAPRGAGARDRGRPGGGRGSHDRRGVPPFGVGFDLLPMSSPGTVVVRVRRFRERDPETRG